MRAKKCAATRRAAALDGTHSLRSPDEGVLRRAISNFEKQPRAPAKHRANEMALQCMNDATAPHPAPPTPPPMPPPSPQSSPPSPPQPTPSLRQLPPPPPHAVFANMLHAQPHQHRPQLPPISPNQSAPAQPPRQLQHSHQQPATNQSTSQPANQY